MTEGANDVTEHATQRSVADKRCYYCGLAANHDRRKPERDHFPKPKSARGTATVLSCWRCHHWKDRLGIESIQTIYEPPVLGYAERSPGHAIALHVTVAALANGEWPWLGDPTSELMPAYDAATDFEVRLFIAKIIAAAWRAISEGYVACTDENDMSVDRRDEWACRYVPPAQPVAGDSVRSEVGP